MTSFLPKTKPWIFVAQGAAISASFATCVLFFGAAMSAHGAANSILNALGAFFITMAFLGCFAAMYYWISQVVD